MFKAEGISLNETKLTSKKYHTQAIRGSNDRVLLMETVPEALAPTLLVSLENFSK